MQGLHRSLIQLVRYQHGHSTAPAGLFCVIVPVHMLAWKRHVQIAWLYLAGIPGDTRRHRAGLGRIQDYSSSETCYFLDAQMHFVSSPFI